MATAKWSTPSALSANLITTELDSKSNGTESALIAFDNSSAKAFYCQITVLLGSVSVSAGASLTLKVYSGDGTNTPHKIDGESYYSQVLTGSGTKVVNFRMVRIYPFMQYFTITNNTGTTLASSGNALHVATFNEEVV